MLIRPHDAATNDDEWRNLLHAHPFGTLIAPGTDRDLPVVVPTHVHFDGNTTIRLHLGLTLSQDPSAGRRAHERHQGAGLALGAGDNERHEQERVDVACADGGSVQDENRFHPAGTSPGAYRVRSPTHRPSGSTDAPAPEHREPLQ